MAAAGIEIIEEEHDAVRFAVFTPVGPVIILTDLVYVEDRLVMDKTHVDGEGLTIAIIRRVAKVFGEVEDVVEVIVQGGDRSSGANRGSSPTPIRVRVK